MSRTVQVNPLVVILSVLVGVELFGFAGALLAIPLSSASCAHTACFLWSAEAGECPAQNEALYGLRQIGEQAAIVGAEVDRAAVLDQLGAQHLQEAKVYHGRAARVSGRFGREGR